MIPTNYLAWRHCIEMECRQPLNNEFAQDRLKALRNTNNTHTKLLQKHYGAEYVRTLIGWFEQTLQTFEKRIV